MARKDEILDALIEIFRSEGISHDFTISQLAKKADIGKSTIYEYFKTKNEILRQAICRVVDTSIDVLKNHTIVDGNFESHFKGELKNVLNAALNSRFLFNLVSPSFGKMFPEEHKEDMREKMKDVTEYYNTRFAQIFGKGVEEGLLNPELLLDNQMIVTSLVTGSIFRLVNVNQALSKDLNIDEYVDKIYNVVLKITN